MTLALLLLDSVLLGIAELMFLPLYLGPVPVPVSALVAALSMPWLVRQAGEAGGTLGAAAAPLLVWLATIGVFGFAGPGSDLLLPLSGPTAWQSVLLVVAGIVPGAWTLAGIARERR